MTLLHTRLHARLHTCLVLALPCMLAWPDPALTQETQRNPHLTYACTTKRGEQLTSDRPIAKCVDVVTRVLNPSGLEVARFGPSLTENEKAQLEARQRDLDAQKAIQREEETRARALLVRFPRKELHDEAREAALERVELVSSVARERLQELIKRREDLQKRIQGFPNPSAVPQSLSGELEENESAIAEQQRFLDSQNQERQRLNERFDGELVQLQKIWAEMR